MKAFFRKPWAPLALLLVLVKVSFVLALGDVFFYGEELEKGAAAKAMLDGLGVPHHQQAYHYYEGGGFVVSHLVALAFAIVGQNLLAHKLIALSFQVGILLVGCLFTRRLFGRHASIWFGLLFIFGPESYQKLSLINLGIHFEACFFLFCVLGLGGKLIFERSQRPRDWFLLGLATGFGLYFSYQVAIAALWVAALLAWCRRKELIGVRGLLGIAGTAVGALPLLVMYWLVGEEVFDIHGTALAGEDSGPSNSVLFREFLASIFIDGSLGERFTPFAWAGFFLGAAGFLVWRTEPLHHPRDHSRKLAAGYVLGYLVLFSITYLSSGFVNGEAYHFFLVLRLVPLWVFGCVLVAAALGELSATPLQGTRNLGIVLGVSLIVVGVRASVAVLRTGRPSQLGDNWSILVGHKGYAYHQYLAKVLPHFEGDRAHKLALIEGFDEPAPGLLRADAVSNLYREELLAACEGDLLRAWALASAEFHGVAPEDEERRRHYALGLGALVHVAHGWDRQRAFDAVAAAPESERAAAFEALGRFGGGGYAFDEALAGEVLRARGEPGYLRGLGRWSYLLHRLDPEGFEELLGAYPEPVRALLREGFEQERAWNLLP